MKGFLCSQDGAYAFPLGPKVTTVGRENCDISINVRSHCWNSLVFQNKNISMKRYVFRVPALIHNMRYSNSTVNNDVSFWKIWTQQQELMFMIVEYKMQPFG